MPGERLLLLADQTELGPKPVGLLQVVAGDLLPLGHPVGDIVGDPGREALVQLRTALLRCALVGRVADQHVAEAEGVLVGERRGLGLDEVLADERHELGSDGVAEPGRREVAHCTAPEPAAHDRGRLHHRPLRE